MRLALYILVNKILTLNREQNDFFVAGSEDGTVCVYSLRTNLLDKLLVRCTLPVRDVALSPDGDWAAVASELSL